MKIQNNDLPSQIFSPKLEEKKIDNVQIRLNPIKMLAKQEETDIEQGGERLDIYNVQKRPESFLGIPLFKYFSYSGKENRTKI